MLSCIVIEIKYLYCTTLFTDDTDTGWCIRRQRGRSSGACRTDLIRTIATCSGWRHVSEIPRLSSVQLYVTAKWTQAKDRIKKRDSSHLWTWRLIGGFGAFRPKDRRS